MIALLALILGVTGIVWLLLELMVPSSPTALRRVRALRDRIQRRRARHSDPFATLRVQRRLEMVAGEIRSIGADRGQFARVHRLDAARAAYDDLLGEACELAGIDVEDAADEEDERWREERELTSRGWSW